MQYFRRLVFLALVFLCGCANVQIPTSDVTATPPRPTIADISNPTVPATLAPSDTPIPAPTIVLPEGGSITIGVIGNLNLEFNVMPSLVQDAVFESLFKIDPANGALKPGLAESFQVSNDATTMTFKLRPGIKWHNGEALTADDVVASIRAFSSSEFRGRPVTDFGTLTRSTAIDSQTVQLTFSDGYCGALTSIGTMKIVPRAVAASPNFPKLTPTQMNGTGPLKFVSRTNDQIVFARNVDYYDGAPHIDSWTIRVFPDSAAMRGAFSNKQIDLMPGTLDDYAALKKIPDANTLRVASDSPEFLSILLNLDTTTLNDPRVRQALAYALDRNALLNDIDGQATLVDSSVLPNNWTYPANLPRFTYDVAQAKRLLADAGWRDAGDGVLKKNGKPMQLELWTEADDPVLEPLAFHIRTMYAALGLQVSLQLDDRPGWVTRAFEHRFDLLLLSRKIPLDPDQRWYWQSDQNKPNDGFNFGSYANTKLDGLFKDLQHAPACDSAARAATSGEIARTLVVDSPVVFLFAPNKYLVAQDRVFGLAPSPFAGDYWNLNNWRVK
ncbi:MAG: hypothetical protein HZB51_29355 [Chloroflexi bacterium]|nr:hypothetical protein [Chloroflexota bacterium]